MNDIQYELREERFEKTDSGKSWKSKPYEVTEEVIKQYNYDLYCDSVKVFKDRVERSYTPHGYMITRMTCVSPCKTDKIVRYFKPFTK